MEAPPSSASVLPLPGFYLPPAPHFPAGLTFKVPLVFPPTFTLILLPRENFRNRKRKEMSEG
jgi:hypothetical protein